MTAFVEDLSTSSNNRASSPVGNRRESYSPIGNESRLADQLGGSAGRFERVNTFGASPPREEDRAGSGF